MKIVDSQLLLVGPRAHRVPTGVALALELLLDALGRAEIPYRVVDVSGTLVGRSIGKFEFLKAFQNLLQFPRILYCLLRSRRLYLILSTSTPGFLRDATIIQCAALLRVPVVIHLHGGGFEHFYRSRGTLGRAWVRWTMSLLERVIVLSTQIAPQFELAGVPQRRIVVVPNALPVDVPHDETAEPLDSVESSDGRFQVLYLSNMIDSKGYKDAIRAIQLLEQRSPGRFQLHLAGEFLRTSSEASSEAQSDSRDDASRIHDPRSLERFVEQHGLTEAVHYYGTVGGAEKIRLLQSAHAMLLPTYYPWEGQPLCIIEALAYGVPVIATEYRGIVDEVFPEQNGYFVQPRQPEQIADRLEQLTASSDHYQAMRRNARQSYEQLFTRDVHIGRMFEVVVPGSQPAPSETRDPQTTSAR